MGLASARAIAGAAVVGMIAIGGCFPRQAVRKEVVRNKVYIDCCNPALNYDEKDMCKWAKDNPGKIIVQGDNLYELTWSDCKVGEEPWRKYE